MFLSSSPSLFYQEFYSILVNLIDQVQAVDTPAILHGLRIGYVIFTTVCFGIFPLVSLLLAAITLSLLPACRGSCRSRMRVLLGLGDVQIPRDSDALKTFLETLRSGLPRNLVVLLVMGLVPFLGVVAGVIYYKLSPVAELTETIDSADLGPVRWVLPPAALTLVAGQPLPVVGPLCMPLLYAIFHAVYDTAHRRRSGVPEALPVIA